MVIEATKLEGNKYWIDFDKDGEVHEKEVTTIDSEDMDTIGKRLIKFASSGFSKQCRKKFKFDQEGLRLFPN